MNEVLAERSMEALRRAQASWRRLTRRSRLAAGAAVLLAVTAGGLPGSQALETPGNVVRTAGDSMVERPYVMTSMDLPGAGLALVEPRATPVTLYRGPIRWAPGHAHRKASRFQKAPAFPGVAGAGHLGRLVRLASNIDAHDDELNCLALNIYFEARGEPKSGQLAVAHVVLNRMADPRFPETVCGVVRQGGERIRHRCQFSWWCDGLSDRPRNARMWAASRAMARLVYWGRSSDPTGGAMWYHADYVMPYWGRVMKKGPKIGRHIFYYGEEETVQIASRE